MAVLGRNPRHIPYCLLNIALSKCIIWEHAALNKSCMRKPDHEDNRRSRLALHLSALILLELVVKRQRVSERTAYEPQVEWGTLAASASDANSVPPAVTVLLTGRRPTLGGNRRIQTNAAKGTLRTARASRYACSTVVWLGVIE
jgi:hypothetical protein